MPSQRHSPAAPSYDCDFCPRLRGFIQENRKIFPGKFNGPVPSFGPVEAELLIVGLAPGLRGANFSGRPFTGDYAGELLYNTLISLGFARGQFKARPDDGLELVNARIAMLKKRVGEISLINLDRIPRDRAGFGSTVHLRDGNGDTIVYQLVMPEESDFEKGMISTSSPIGRAILNKEEGDQVKVTTPNGVRAFELIKISTIHDEE